MTSPSSRIFLCHSSADKAKVRELYHRLKKDGYYPWLDEEDLLPGQDWQYEIRKAVRSSAIVIVCLSRNSVNKRGYVQKEICFALDAAEEQPEGKIFIIPVRLEDCEVPARLSRWHWMNLYEANGYQRLIKAIGITQCDSIKKVKNLEKTESDFKANINFERIENKTDKDNKIFISKNKIVITSFVIVATFVFFYYKFYPAEVKKDNQIATQQDAYIPKKENNPISVTKENKVVTADAANQKQKIEKTQSATSAINSTSVDKVDQECTGECAQMEEVAKPYRKVINNKNASDDQKALADVYLHIPYEYECSIESVDEQIGRYESFIKKFPKSSFIPEAQISIAGLNMYLLQCYEKDSDKRHLFEKVKNIYKRISMEYSGHNYSTTANNIYNILSSYEKREKEIDFFKINYDYKVEENHNLLLKEIPLCTNTP
ncbi:MAG: TIR domain-containing protein [Candidatus Electronema aureum]|uniref:TIR domain-containing protein n=1 Tax=Candidatus Electronema aureum TaxID=2005002 RepID=A0A521G2I2_9BACT|nr:MAG: TIR domain-containing protein [Candidatus Electronema aureum]